MSHTVLGISAYYHDSAAALVRGGEIIAAAQEERFSRKKHDPRFPKSAINYCLEEALIEPQDIDAVIFYDHPLLTLDRVIKNCIAAGPHGEVQFKKAARSTLGTKLWVEDEVRKCIGSLGKRGRLLYSKHHMSHAASAFFPSPFDEAAIITVDGVGEWQTTTIGFGRDNNIGLLQEINYPHSLGLLYSAFTYLCGFKVNSGEYKLMGLAPYGEPVFESLIREHLIDIKQDGSYRLNTEYFGYLDSLAMTNDKMHTLLGPPRTPESRITKREMNLAASIQRVTEDVMLRIARYARKEIGMKNLCLAGGVALNCVANGKILSEDIFEHMWIQPAAGDAGGALGAALMGSHVYFNDHRAKGTNNRDRQKGSYLGPAYSDAEIGAFLERHGYPFRQLQDFNERASAIADALAQGKIVGFFSGRMEYGPRALGARSILGDPRRKETQSVMNLKIKYRESFRPFAPSCIVEETSKYFELNTESPYMLLVAPVKKEHQIQMDENEILQAGEDMIQVVNMPRSDIPAVTHVDYSARIQTVSTDDNPFFYRVISFFKELTGIGLVVNTSFNVRGEPIVCSPQDAYRCFMRTDMDLLMLESYILVKEDQPRFKDDHDWRKQYELD
ncbi:MAG: carbamoyltransferase [Candidatus Omnitrophica bacterium]|nr:carbamoyltransferase [Candidatus Omnitrophota bacterium]